MLIPEAVAHFIQSRDHCAKDTIVWYEQILKPLAEYFKDSHLENIDADLLREYRQMRRDQTTTRGTPRANASLNGELKAIRALFAFAVQRRWIVRNPALELKRIRTEHQREPLEVAQVATILKYLKEREGEHLGLRNLALFVLILDSDIRRGEAAALKIEDVSLEAGTVAVTGKGDKQRTVGIVTETCELLRRYIGERTAGPLFLNEDGTGLAAISLRKVFDKVARETGIHFSAHTLRRTGATLMYLDGLGDSDLMRVMGHSNLSTTRVYIQQALEQRAREQQRAHSAVRQFAAVIVGTVEPVVRRREFTVEREGLKSRFRLIK